MAYLDGWQLMLLLAGMLLRLLTGGPTRDLSMWLGLPTALKLGFDRDHSNRGKSTISGETARLLRS